MLTWEAGCGTARFSGVILHMSSTSFSVLRESYLEALLAGDRVTARQLVEDALAHGNDAYELLNNLIWPMMEHIQNLYRDDRISISSLNLGTRLNRSITDQLTAESLAALVEAEGQRN